MKTEQRLDLTQITPELITQFLHKDGTGAEANVTHLRSEIVTGEVSFNAQIVRLWLTYDQPRVEGPRSLILKLPTTNAALLANATVFQPGTKEDWFYRRIAPLNQIQAPRCYYSTVDPATGGVVLLLEDLTATQRINQVTGVSAAEAQLALQALASLHVHWWNHHSAPEITELLAINGSGEAGSNLVEKLYADAWPQFVISGVTSIPAEVKRFGEYLVGRVAAAESLLNSVPPTLIHGDFRLDNMLFALQTERPICWLVDWEDVNFNNPAVDLAWFLGGCLQLAESCQEEALLRFYHAHLVAGGVAGYPWAQCVYDYRCAMIGSFVQGVLSSLVNENATAYKRQFAHTVASRFMTACQRLRLGELLEGKSL